MFFSFKTVGYLQVIYQPLSRPKQIRAGEYAVGRKIGLERIKLDVLCLLKLLTLPQFAVKFVYQQRTIYVSTSARLWALPGRNVINIYGREGRFEQKL
jgi:hypothetical protein